MQLIWLLSQISPLKKIFRRNVQSVAFEGSHPSQCWSAEIFCGGVRVNICSSPYSRLPGHHQHHHHHRIPNGFKDTILQYILSIQIKSPVLTTVELPKIRPYLQRGKIQIKVRKQRWKMVSYGAPTRIKLGGIKRGRIVVCNLGDCGKRSVERKDVCCKALQGPTKPNYSRANLTGEFLGWPLSTRAVVVIQVLLQVTFWTP